MLHALHPAPAVLLALCGALGIPNEAFAQVPEPSLEIPGAVDQPPDWLKATKTPFDLDAFFALPRPEENAAPLYLDVFCDLDESAASFLLKGRPDRESRMAAAKARDQAFTPIWSRFSDQPFSVPIQEIDQALVPYEALLSRLIQAQARPRCVFATGLSLDSILAHAQAARVPARVLDMRAHASLFRGHFGDAIRDSRAALRLARDLRHRGGCITQLVSFAIENVILQQTIPRFLQHPNLTTRHIDELIAILQQHLSETIDPLQTAARTEYLVYRIDLHKLAALSKDLGNDAHEYRLLFTRLLFEGANEGSVHSFAPQLARFSSEDEARIVSLLDRQETTIESVSKLPPHQRSEKLEALQKDLQVNQKNTLEAAKADSFKSMPKVLEARVLDEYLDSLDRLSQAADSLQARGNATLAILALRRYELEKHTAAPNLITAVKAALIKTPLLDPYDGKPLRALRQGNEWLVYSIGKDRIDQKGQVDSDQGRNPAGDLLFRIPRPSP
jgi:hypothetical protein